MLKCLWKFGICFFVKTCDEQLTRLWVFQFVWLYWTVCWEYEEKKYHTLYFHDKSNCFLGIRNSLALGRFSIRIRYIFSVFELEYMQTTSQHCTFTVTQFFGVTHNLVFGLPLIVFLVMCIWLENLSVTVKQKTPCSCYP